MSGLPQLIAGVDDEDDPALADCGCGTATATFLTPLPIANRPGLTEVGYRAGTFAEFKATQLARLSSSEYPALRQLQSREPDDFSVALIDAWSCVCEVLTFYQERNANEAWLGTALERSSIGALGQLIGYELSPGVAAATDMVVLFDNPPGIAGNSTGGPVGSPSFALDGVTIPSRTRIQSVPGPDETAQTFETAEPLDARRSWNALTPRQTTMRLPAKLDMGVWLAGLNTGLKVGDAIVIVGAERLAKDTGSERWDFRKLTRVAPDNQHNRTWVEFTHALGSFDPPSGVARNEVQIFAFRARTALFGANAPHPKVLAEQTHKHYEDQIGQNGDWQFALGRYDVVLESVQEGWLSGSLVALTVPGAGVAGGYVELYRIVRSEDDGRSQYSVSGRATRLSLDSEENLRERFQPRYRSVSVYGKSEELFLAETPIEPAPAGASIELSELVADLLPGRRLIFRGRRAQALVTGSNIELVSAEAQRPLVAGERLTLLAATGESQSWSVRDAGGVAGTVDVSKGGLAWVPADNSAEIIAEAATLAALALTDGAHTRLDLAAPLGQAFDRSSTVINANVVPATHGETTREILGDGSNAKPFQSFTLKQAPLTHISAATETGRLSTLELRVDDLLWKERPTLFGLGPRERAYEVRMNEAGASVVQFGDGVSGARLPSGRNNIVATYRKGIGRAGSVRAGTLSTLLDRPLGLKEAFNPLPAVGGDDPETSASARSTAPITTLTLGRVVSLRNYEDFARSFAGISKAKADWVWDGETRRIAVTLAGVDGAAVTAETGTLYDNLSLALRKLGDPFVRVHLASYRPATFRLAMKVKIDPDHERDTVLAALEAALRSGYGFAQRGFARLVTASEIIATAHSVAEVVAVDFDLLYRTVPPNAQPILHQRLLADPARASGASILAAEILTLDPAPIELRIMP